MKQTNKYTNIGRTLLDTIVAADGSASSDNETFVAKICLTQIY